MDDETAYVTLRKAMLGNGVMGWIDLLDRMAVEADARVAKARIAPTLDVRTQLAGQIAAGLAAKHGTEGWGAPEDFAAAVVEATDALLKALSKGGGK